MKDINCVKPVAYRQLILLPAHGTVTEVCPLRQFRDLLRIAAMLVLCDIHLGLL